jgi:hypothetical protein
MALLVFWGIARMRWGAFVALLPMVAAPEFAVAQNCRIDVGTGKCIFVPGAEQRKPDFTVGDKFPVYEHNMLINIDRYGLPPVDGNWRYYRSGIDIYRVDAQNYTVLEVIRNAGLR